MNCVTTAHPAALDPDDTMTGFNGAGHDIRRDIRYGAAVYGCDWGVVAGFRSGAPPLRAVILGAGQGMLGVALLVLERLIH